MSDTLVYR